MKLLQATWSVMLILDHIHQRLHNSLPDSTVLPNGQKFDLLTLSLFGMSELLPQLHDLTARLQQISFDVSDYICLKFILMLDPSKLAEKFVGGSPFRDTVMGSLNSIGQC